MYGQPNLTSTLAGVTQQLMNGTVGLALGTDGSLYVSGDNRVLVFPPIPPSTTLPITAVDVLGQTSFTSNTAGSGLAQFDAPLLMEWDSAYDCLWIADGNNNRVVRWSTNAAPSGSPISVTWQGKTPNVSISPIGKTK